MQYRLSVGFKIILNEDRPQPAQRLHHPFRPPITQIHRQRPQYPAPHAAIEHKKRNQFNPYQDNGGTVVAIAGDNFVVIGGDSRLSEGYSIVTRGESKLVQLTDKTVLATSGMYADFCELRRVRVG